MLNNSYIYILHATHLFLDRLHGSSSPRLITSNLWRPISPCACWRPWWWSRLASGRPPPRRRCRNQFHGVVYEWRQLVGVVLRVHLKCHQAWRSELCVIGCGGPLNMELWVWHDVCAGHLWHMWRPPSCPGHLGLVVVMEVSCCVPSSPPLSFSCGIEICQVFLCSCTINQFYRLWLLRFYSFRDLDLVSNMRSQ
jgi:hypothetical protein